jgi:uncharacterized protein (TIGR03118 family)
MFHPRHVKTRSRISVSAALAFLLLLITLPPAPTKSARAEDRNPNIPALAPGEAYAQTNYVSDIPGFAFLEDRLLVNPWGLDVTPSSLFSIANAGTNTSTYYVIDDQEFPLARLSPDFKIAIPGGPPTGMVFNPHGSEFIFTNGSASGSASFIFASLTGNIAAWSLNVPAPGSTTAFIVVSRPRHRYTSLTSADIPFSPSGPQDFLYATDFASGQIDVFDSKFQPVFVPGNFVAPGIPPDYHPFSIQKISDRNNGDLLYVAYAKVGPTGQPVTGAGNGYVRLFTTGGRVFTQYAINQGKLNAPWGLAQAPADFGKFSNMLLVGNFGADGPSINAYDTVLGNYVGSLQNEAGEDIHIDGLRALLFGSLARGGEPNTLYFTAGAAREEHGLFGKLNPTTATATSLIQFATNSYVIGEGSRHIDITVTRSGDASGTASVNYNTFDESSAGHASQKSDYEISLGKLTFNPGETSKTFRVLLVDDAFVEGDETVSLALSNPTGVGVGLGSPNTADLKILDNEALSSSANPIDDAQFFVRQQYLDFLNREPDTAGFNFWTNQIISCGSDAACIERKRINVSAAFFLSIEFQRTGLLAYLTHKAAFGNQPASFGASAPVLYGEFERDTQALQKDFIFGAPGADAALEANKQAYFNDFVLRLDFIGQYLRSLTPVEFVDALYRNAGITPMSAERQAAIDEFGGTTDTADQAARARVLRRVAENAAFARAEFRPAFVLMEYFGYLRRDPDAAGFNFWLDKLNSFSGDYIRAEMVKAFINSDEYRQRFGS